MIVLEEVNVLKQMSIDLVEVGIQNNYIVSQFKGHIFLVDQLKYVGLALRFSPVATLDQYEMILAERLGRTCLEYRVSVHKYNYSLSFMAQN